jgi:Ty3 transposon capsid-like protein
MRTRPGAKMALVGDDDIQVHQDNDNGNAGTTDWDGDATCMAAASGATGGTGTINFNLRVEQNKISEFFGTKSKDTISAADFIRRLQDFAKTNWWTDAQTNYHFANALCNVAREWLPSVVDWDDEEHDQPLWSDFKDVFKQEYTVQMNKRLILEELANLAMKPSETRNELLKRITRTTRVIKESFTEYGGITLDP